MNDKSDLVMTYQDEVTQAIWQLDQTRLQQIAEDLLACHERGGNIYIAGNGGSAATASHMVCDLHKNTGKHLRVIALNDNIPTLTAVANDEYYDQVFENWDSFFRTKDTLILISTSGESNNILKMAQAAEITNPLIIGLMGINPNCRLAKYCDYAVHVQSQNIGVVEDVHLVINHILTELIREL